MGRDTDLLQIKLLIDIYTYYIEQIINTNPIITMLHRRLVASSYRLRGPLASFSTTVAIFSGAPSKDAETLKIIQGVRKSFNEPVNFIGVVGDNAKGELSKVYDNSLHFHHNPIEVHHEYQEALADSAIVPYRTPTHYKNALVLKNLFSNNILDDFLSNHVSAVISVGNFAFTKRFNRVLSQYYTQAGKVSPPTFLYDPLINVRRVENEAFLDFQFFNLPRKIDSWSGYTFPSLCIGYEGLWEAYRFLNQYRTEGSSKFNLPNFSRSVHELVQKARTDFRTKKAINEDTYVTAFYPGNNKQEAEFTLKSLAHGVEVFFSDSKVNALGKSVFQLVVVLPKDKAAADVVRTSISKVQDRFKSILTVDYNERHAAFAASDFGIVHDGEIAVEAAACQLPAVVLNSCSIPWAYVSNMLNMFESPLNVALLKLGYEEIKSSSSANSDLLGISMQNHFHNPKQKFFYIELYENMLQEMLKKSGRNPEMDLSETGHETSYNTIRDFSKKYSRLDVNKLDTRWGWRKAAITP